jgi:hypothetical protein
MNKHLLWKKRNAKQAMPEVSIMHARPRRPQKTRSQIDFGPMDRYSKQTPQASKPAAQTVHVSTLLPSGLYRRRRLCKAFACSPHSCIQRYTPSARGLTIFIMLEDGSPPIGNWVYTLTLP